MIYNLLKLIHILGVVFMSAPLYSLVIVNERALFSPMMVYSVDRYMENLIKKQAARCYVFQLTVLISGFWLVYLGSGGFSPVLIDLVLATKTIILLVLIGLLSYIHISIQPRIEALLAKVSGDPIPVEIAAGIKPLRMKRKKLASFCLFLVLSAIILGLQVFTHFNLVINAVLFLLAAIFAWRAYKVPVPFGWV